MKHSFSRITLFFLSAFLLIVGGCATTEPARFYLLHPIAEPSTTAHVTITKPSLTIGLGPIELPEYLNRPQIVTRLSQSELYLSDFNRWAEPLEDTFSRVLAENLMMLSGNQQLEIFPWEKLLPFDYQLVVKVLRFDGTLGEDAVLIAHWTILKEDGNKVLMEKKSLIREPSGALGYEAMVEAKSRALEKLSREIADAIGSLSKTTPNP